ncbi:hypothetical protein Tco_0955620 [Tanacetum coccineum]|uniref:Uncharacterized protein n=1 Tax=Tanacetum coccineum TaxID=301880 RepID=A0ABQ5E7P6_9ASTR
MQEVILFYNGLGIPTRQILDSRGAIPSKTAADAKVAIQEMVEYSQKWHNGTCRSLNIFLVCLDHLCHLAILSLDQHAHTLHHLESLLAISLDNLCLDNLDILKEDLE